jgi:hypothetical protein
MASRVLCVLCPAITASCPDSVEAGHLATFTVSGADAEKLTYNWTVDQGRITSGQGTRSINVDTTKLAGKTVTATVEIGGIDPACPRTSSCTAQVTAPRN